MDIRDTAAVTLTVARQITPDRLTAATPCPEYDVRGLIGHLLQWGPMLVAAGHKRAAGPADDSSGAAWMAAFEAHTADLVAAWSPAQAWQGEAPMGAPMPAPLVGGLVLGEVIVHGWDLARATGQSAHWPEDAVRSAYEAAAATAEQGRAMGAYGPEITVPAGASTMDRLLAVTGRDPQWRVS
jgi:uncharacterized protein (TIGR03086 family)